MSKAGENVSDLTFILFSELKIASDLGRWGLAEIAQN